MDINFNFNVDQQLKDSGSAKNTLLYEGGKQAVTNSVFASDGNKILTTLKDNLGNTIFNTEGDNSKTGAGNTNSADIQSKMDEIDAEINELYSQQDETEDVEERLEELKDERSNIKHERLYGLHYDGFSECDGYTRDEIIEHVDKYGGIDELRDKAENGTSFADWCKGLGSAEKAQEWVDMYDAAQEDLDAVNSEIESIESEKESQNDRLNELLEQREDLKKANNIVNDKEEASSGKGVMSQNEREVKITNLQEATGCSREEAEEIIGKEEQSLHDYLKSVTNDQSYGLHAL